MSEPHVYEPASHGIHGESQLTYAQKFWTSAASTLVVFLMIVLGNYAWRSYADNARDRRFYFDLVSILAQIHHAREEPSPNFNLACEKANYVCAAIRSALGNVSDADFEERLTLESIAKWDLPILMQKDLATVSEAEIAFAGKLIKLGRLLKLPPPSFDPDPDELVALDEIERLGGIITREPRRPIQPVTAIVMKGDQFLDTHLEHLPKVAYLEIDSTEITDGGMQKLRRIRSLTTCRLRCAKVTDVGIANLAALPSLSEVHLYDCTGITESGLLKLRRIQRLALFGSHITDEMLAVLKDFPDLHELMLRGDSLTDDGIGSLVSLPSLTTLVLSHCHNLSDAAFTHIADVQNLVTLVIDGSDITDAGLESIGMLPRLERLAIQPCEGRMPNGLQITDTGLIRMKNLSSLQSFSIRTCPGVSDASVSLLQSLASLTILQLNETGITEEGHRHIASSLPNTQVDFVLTPPSPLDSKLTSDHADDLPPVQLSASCAGWPVPDSQASLRGTYTVQELEKEYRMSRGATDAKYDGKLIEISGPVAHVGNNLEGDPIIRLTGSDEKFEIDCVLRSASDLMNAVEGESCRLRGVYCISIVPTFIHCTLMKTAENTGTDVLESSTPLWRADQQLPDVTLTAEQLESEVAANAEEAHRKYAGKVLQVTGRVSRISHVMFGAMVYRMGPPLGTQYFLRTGNPWYCARPGQTIALTGKWFSGYPCLVNCEVISVTGTPNATLTAQALGEYLESDRVRFRKWFYLKQIMVTGEVIGKGQPDANSNSILNRFAITLLSTQNTSIICEMDVNELSASKSVRIGDTVTITGWNTKETPTDAVILVECLFWRGK